MTREGDVYTFSEKQFWDVVDTVTETLEDELDDDTYAVETPDKGTSIVTGDGVYTVEAVEDPDTMRTYEKLFRRPQRIQVRIPQTSQVQNVSVHYDAKGSPLSNVLGGNGFDEGYDALAEIRDRLNGE